MSWGSKPGLQPTDCIIGMKSGFWSCGHLLLAMRNDLRVNGRLDDNLLPSEAQYIETSYESHFQGYLIHYPNHS